MDVGTDSTPTGVCKLGCGAEGQSIRCTQLSCDTAQLRDGTAVRRPTGKVAGPGYTALLQEMSSSLLFQAKETRSSVVPGKGTRALQPRGRLTSTGAVPAPGPEWVYPHANEGSKTSHFDWPNKRGPDCSEWSCSDWSTKMLMRIEQHSSDWTGKPQSYWSN